MSQRLWTIDRDGKTFEILTGWDRPLRRFFLVVEDLNAPDDAPNSVAYLYSNLADPVWEGSLAAVVGKLQSLGIPYPKSLIRDLAHDRLRNAGNDRHTYGVVR